MIARSYVVAPSWARLRLINLPAPWNGHVGGRTIHGAACANWGAHQRFPFTPLHYILSAARLLKVGAARPVTAIRSCGRATRIDSVHDGRLGGISGRRSPPSSYHEESTSGACPPGHPRAHRHRSRRRRYPFPAKLLPGHAAFGSAPSAARPRPESRAGRPGWPPPADLAPGHSEIG